MQNFEIHIISNRPKLDQFIEYWSDVVIDIPFDLIIKVLMFSYDEKSFILQNGIKVRYIKQLIKPKTSHMNQAFARNYLLCNCDQNTKYILFFDDWQKPDENILTQHYKYLQKGYSVCGRRLECDQNGDNCKIDLRNTGFDRICSYGYFWTCNSSTSYSNIISVNGFDNRYCGGTGGEDYDLALRLTHAGQHRFIYNPNAICYHYNHDAFDAEHNIATASTKNKNCNHSDLTKYKYIPEYGHFGDWNIMHSKKYDFYIENGIKYFKCKSCGEQGIVDSLQVYKYNIDKHVVCAVNGLREMHEKFTLEQLKDIEKSLKS